MRQNFIFDMIRMERERQNKLHSFFPMIDEYRLPILAEEFGEVAHAINEKDDENLIEELVQTASVCVRWLEQLELKEQSKTEHVELLKDKVLSIEQIEAWERLGYDMSNWRNINDI